jgi:ornithine cyclodeaminase
MGSDQAEKNELDPVALARADTYVCDRVSQAEALGELRAAIAAGTWTRGTPPELGAVVAGAVPGRRAPSDITICDLTGTGAQDTAIATRALAACHAAGAGTVMRA